MQVRDRYYLELLGIPTSFSSSISPSRVLFVGIDLIFDLSQENDPETSASAPAVMRTSSYEDFNTLEGN